MSECIPHITHETLNKDAGLVQCSWNHPPLPPHSCDKVLAVILQSLCVHNRKELQTWYWSKRVLCSGWTLQNIQAHTLWLIGSLIVMQYNWNLHSHTPKVLTRWFSEHDHYSMNWVQLIAVIFTSMQIMRKVDNS